MNFGDEKSVRSVRPRRAPMPESHRASVRKESSDHRTADERGLIGRYPFEAGAYTYDALGARRG